MTLSMVVSYIAISSVRCYHLAVVVGVVVVVFLTVCS